MKTLTSGHGNFAVALDADTLQIIENLSVVDDNIIQAAHDDTSTECLWC